MEHFADGSGVSESAATGSDAESVSERHCAGDSSYAAAVTARAEVRLVAALAPCHTVHAPQAAGCAASDSEPPRLPCPQAAPWQSTFTLNILVW